MSDVQEPFAKNEVTRTARRLSVKLRVNKKGVPAGKHLPIHP